MKCQLRKSVKNVIPVDPLSNPMSTSESMKAREVDNAHRSWLMFNIFFEYILYKIKIQQIQASCPTRIFYGRTNKQTKNENPGEEKMKSLKQK